VSLLNAIDSAVGIQYQGVTDQSGSAPAGRLVNGLIVGDFGRGRVNQPMFITKDALAQLGDESKPAYQTVADCLDTGVPGVWVMRVMRVAPPAIPAWLWDDNQPVLWDDNQSLELQT